MKLLISGVCGFVGRQIAEALLDSYPAGELEIVGLDNLSRPGSWLNREPLKRRGVQLVHGDIRQASDLESLGTVDWVLDAAANPSVLAGIDGKSSSRQLVEHNLMGTVNLLEFCKKRGAGFVLISTSRVYGIKSLVTLPVEERGGAFTVIAGRDFPRGVSVAGIDECYTTAAPVSLYGATKLASEALALDYGGAFGFPVWINRCGVLAGAGQFGRADQGIFSYWIHSWRARRPLRYIGFGGGGLQVRDCLHPVDLLPLLMQQFRGADPDKPPIVNLGGGVKNSISLKQLSGWCADRFGEHNVEVDAQPRPFDLPWLIMDSSLAAEAWDWKPSRDLHSVLGEIADHADANPDWLELSAS